MHRKNIKVFVFTLNESEKIAKAVNLGADGIISDDHKLATELMEAVSV
jgi:glycerophosphoryl diester phosphodiesterase